MSLKIRRQVAIDILRIERLMQASTRYYLTLSDRGIEISEEGAIEKILSIYKNYKARQNKNCNSISETIFFKLLALYAIGIDEIFEMITAAIQNCIASREDLNPSELMEIFS